MATIKHEAKATAETVMSTELNGLANGSRAISSGAVSNDAAGELYLYGDFRLYLPDQPGARSAGAAVILWILPEVNNVYPYGSATLEPQASLIMGSFSFDAASNYRDAVLRDIPLPPSDFRILVKNKTGQAFAATLNVLVLERHNLQTS